MSQAGNGRLTGTAGERFTAGMIRTGDEYRESIRDGREVWIDGERVADVTTHPAFKPPSTPGRASTTWRTSPRRATSMTYVDEGTGERCAIARKLPRTREDWHAKRRAVDTVMDDLARRRHPRRRRDGRRDVVAVRRPGRAQRGRPAVRRSNIRRHVAQAQREDPFHVSANTDPKGDRSKRPQDQDPDMLLHVVRETDSGIVVRGAKYETAAAYANQAFVKPTIANWGDAELSDYAVGFIVDMGSPRHASTSAARASPAARPAADYPSANRFDEVDTLVVFDDVEIPWENVLFYRHTRAATYIRATLHRYSAFAYTQRVRAPGRPA